MRNWGVLSCLPAGVGSMYVETRTDSPTINRASENEPMDIIPRLGGRHRGRENTVVPKTIPLASDWADNYEAPPGNHVNHDNYRGEGPPAADNLLAAHQSQYLGLWTRTPLWDPDPPPLGLDTPA